MTNKAALLRWSAALRAGAGPAAVRAGQAVLAAELRRVVPDRKGRVRGLEGVGPAVLVTPPRVGPAGASGSIYVGARFARRARAALLARGPAAESAMRAALGKKGV